MANSDFIQFEDNAGRILHRMLNLSLGWPPPPYLECNGGMFTRVSHSDLTEEDMKTCTHVARGALYRPTPEGEAQAVRETTELMRANML